MYKSWFSNSSSAYDSAHESLPSPTTISNFKSKPRPFSLISIPPTSLSPYPTTRGTYSPLTVDIPETGEMTMSGGLEPHEGERDAEREAYNPFLDPPAKTFGRSGRDTGYQDHLHYEIESGAGNASLEPDKSAHTSVHSQNADAERIVISRMHRTFEDIDYDLETGRQKRASDGSRDFRRCAPLHERPCCNMPLWLVLILLMVKIAIIVVVVVVVRNQQNNGDVYVD